MRLVQAFTLLELLTVIAIIAIIAGFVIAGGRGQSGAVSLTGEGDKVSGLVHFARQTAMARSSLTALILNVDPASEGYLRAVSVWEAVPRSDGKALTAGDWKQLTRWEILRPGVIFMPPQTASGEMDVPSAANIAALPNVEFRKATLSPGSGYLIKYFLPSGGLRGSTSGVLKLAEGHAEAGGGVVYTHAEEGVPQNLYTVTIVSTTGYSLVSRP